MLKEKLKKLEGRQKDTLLIGRATIDLNPVDLNMPLEESVIFKKYLGGSPANIAIGLSRLEQKVGFLGGVSQDQHGKFILNYFNKNNVDTSQMVQIPEKKTGLTFTEIKSTTESSILMYRDEVADLAITPDMVSEEYVKQFKCFVVSGTALSKSPSRETVFKTLEYSKKHGLIVIFDIDYRPYSWSSLTDIDIYYSMVGRQSDVIIGSREEFTLMEKHVAENNTDDDISAKIWIESGNSVVIIKHGKEGSKAYTNEGETHLVKPYNVKLLKSFGGGDAYASAFIYSLVKGYELEDALELASAHAAMLVASHSCSEEMKTIQEIEEFQKNNRR